ncbi:galactose-1-phosphate uridylyltransferase [bacterium]|nr:galactose-1-phosphate uridylyltransferase [bacterium]
MINKKKDTELRNNLLSGDWVIIAPARSNVPRGNNECPFCSLKDQEEPVLIYNNGKVVNDKTKWTTIVIPNKYPVFTPFANECSSEKESCFKMRTPGHHELVITSNHDKNISELPIKRIKEIFDCYQSRIQILKKNKLVKYISIFQNCGEKAGASQKHPHSQIITIPFIDKELQMIISNSKDYFERNNKCLHCEIIEREIRDKQRLVLENNTFIAYVPYAPKFTFQIIIAPKKHRSLFEDIAEEEKIDLADILKKAINKYKKKLNDYAYNFFIYNSPNDNKDHSFFHWYLILIPRIGYMGGFEVGANMEIITRYPEDQAKILK